MDDAEPINSTKVDIEAARGDEIRSMHHLAFRSEEWARVIGVGPVASGPIAFGGGGMERCYVMQWPDGVIDYTPIHGDRYEYEIRPAEGPETVVPG